MGFAPRYRLHPLPGHSYDGLVAFIEGTRLNRHQGSLARNRNSILMRLPAEVVSVILGMCVITVPHERTEVVARLRKLCRENPETWVEDGIDIAALEADNVRDQPLSLEDMKRFVINQGRANRR